MQIQKIKVSKLHVNPANPRIIKDEKFKALVESIKKFPEMLDVRPIVCNKEFMILGGDKRFKASKEAGLTEVPCIIADNFNPAQEKEFIIRDNVSSGEWDWKLLADDWDEDFLKDIGVDVFHGMDFSTKNMEISTEGFDTDQVMKLKYNENDFKFVRESLAEISATPEEAVIQLIKLHQSSIDNAEA